MNHMQKTILELERAFHKMKQEYEEEIARLKRGDDISEDHRPLLPSSTAGQVALAGLHSAVASVGEKRNSASLGTEDATRNVRMRENSQSGGAISDIATAAMASTGSIASSSTSTNATSAAYDWIVTYNPKAQQRLLSLDLLQSINFEGVVCCVRFSSSGAYLAASGNKLCAIYDAKSGMKLVSLPHDSTDGSDLYVRSLTFNDSDTLFATGSEDNAIRVWDISSIKAPVLTQTLKGHTQDVYALEFVDTERIVSGSGDQSLKLWNVLSGECLATARSAETVDQREAGITSLAISHDRKRIVTGSLDRLVRVYEIASDESTASIKQIETFEGHLDSVYSVTFDATDSNVISGSLDKTIRKWSLDPASTTKCLQTIANHRDFVLSVAVSSTKSARPFIISGSKDRTVQFWDEIGQAHQLTLQGHKNSVISVAISPIGGVFATGSGDGRARIWSFTSKTE